MLQKVIPDMLIDARSVSPKVENASKSHLAGEQIILEYNTKALSADCFLGGLASGGQDARREGAVRDASQGGG